MEGDTLLTYAVVVSNAIRLVLAIRDSCDDPSHEALSVVEHQLDSGVELVTPISGHHTLHRLESDATGADLCRKVTLQDVGSPAVRDQDSQDFIVAAATLV